MLKDKLQNNSISPDECARILAVTTAALAGEPGSPPAPPSPAATTAVTDGTFEFRTLVEMRAKGSLAGSVESGFASRNSDASHDAVDTDACDASTATVTSSDAPATTTPASSSLLSSSSSSQA